MSWYDFSWLWPISSERKSFAFERKTFTQMKKETHIWSIVDFDEQHLSQMVLQLNHKIEYTSNECVLLFFKNVDSHQMIWHVNEVGSFSRFSSTKQTLANAFA